MDFQTLFSNTLFQASVLTLLINLPFGYLRGGERRLSFKWFLYIHLPIPLIVAIRFWLHLGFKWETYPALILMFFLGQAIGARYRKLKDKKSDK